MATSEIKSFVPFVSVGHMVKLVQTLGLENILRELASYIEEDFRRWPQFEKTPRLASHSDEGVIELMPTCDGAHYGFKYVNGHPYNGIKGLQTVAAFGLYADVESGYPLLLSEMTLLTALRTAATSAMAASFLARKDSKVMAIIGNGAQSDFQASAFKALLGITILRVYDIDQRASQKLAKNLRGRGFDITICQSVEDAVCGADIITTVTADKRQNIILSDNHIGKGVHINAVGGDCPGKTELHKDILLKSDIFVEFPPQTRIEGEIQQLDADHKVNELWEVISNKNNQPAQGRTTSQQITLFDSVGFAIEDFSALRFIYDKAQQTGFYQQLDMIANPEDPRDLFGLLTTPEEDS